ncbi:flavin reductase family protein [Streptomyces sp. ALI-76-A]|jgi:flavin reductase (DIM6/NTAB) family NADH-FMN oxidoreductase RutF|uniref:flavin reductase family protein n=1 Tax=Streptomyces sp. ALI-76-A TaxID=3025736 RepID=UPI00256F23FC|nr:flavin reductase family protein [Streptomyces sp. ALI-76-A]MDL5198984.1 flavin reductase family protein [Streptomyces sp. ALI-76-A]
MRPCRAPVRSLAAAAFLACRLARTVEIADHILLVGSPLNADHDAAAAPLVLHRRREHVLNG